MARLSIPALLLVPLALSVALTTTMFAPVAEAQTQLKIAVVNVPRLLEEAPQAKGAMQALQDEFSPRQREMAAQQKDLKAKEEKLGRDGAVMADNERRNAEKELREGQRDLARKQNEYVEDLNVRRNEELGKLQKALLQEVQTFARASGYDLVVGDGVLFVNESLDITPQVLTALQTRAKTGGGVKPATPPAKPATPPAKQ